MAFGVKRGPRITSAHKKQFNDESLCNHCGACCYLSFEVDKQTVIVKELPCRHLRFDKDGKSQCAIYDRRLETDFCYKVSTRTVRWGFFPHDCPYVEGIKGYKGKVYLDDHPELYEKFFQYYDGSDRPDFIRARDWNNFFNPPKSRQRKKAG